MQFADRIADASDVYPSGTGAERVHRTFWTQTKPLEPLFIPDRVASSTHAVNVTVNDGRWIIVCPDCGEGQVAARDDHRFLCFTCRNVHVEGLWRPVIWPNAKDIAAIEHELMKRPYRDEHRRGPRNWRPGETAEDLQREALDQVRPSIPRLEDLDKATQRSLVAVHNDPNVVDPVVRWDDLERTQPAIEWKREHRKHRVD